MKSVILYSEINVACILFLLLLCFKVKQSLFLQEHQQLYFRVVVSNTLFLMLDFFWIFVDNNVIGVSTAANWILNCAYFILSGILGYCWFAYSEAVQESRFARERRLQRLALLPLALLVVLTLSSPCTGWLFYIDALNHYHRGPAYPLQLLISYGYIIFTAAKAFYRSLDATEYRKKTELKSLAAFVLPTVLAGGMQVAFSGYPILCVGDTFGLLYIYLTMQEQMISRDALTKLSNRSQLMQVLSTKLVHPREDKVLYLLIMDVDYFKAINDCYGHVEGDHALKTVANCLLKVCASRNYFVCRFGGDEFVALCELNPGDSIQTVCEAIHAELKQVDTPYTLSLSIGWAKYAPLLKSQQEFIELADRELYKVKKGRLKK